MKIPMKLLLMVLILVASLAHAGELEDKANSALRKIGIGPEQADAYAVLYEDFLSNRNAQMRRVLHSRTGEEVGVMARKRAKRAAKKSVKKMRAVLSEHQLKYYEQYLEYANEIFLRDSGLR